MPSLSDESSTFFSKNTKNIVFVSFLLKYCLLNNIHQDKCVLLEACRKSYFNFFIIVCLQLVFAVVKQICFDLLDLFV